MSTVIDIPMPPVLVSDEATQLRELRNYLQRLALTLRTSLQDMDAGVAPVTVRVSGKKSEPAPDQTQITFNALKALIITSADIIEAYYEETERRFSGKYVASSEFGTYSEQTSQRILDNSTATDRLFQNLQQIVSDVGGLKNAIIEVNARIRTGLLYYDADGVPVYGVEVGQRNVKDGEEVFNKYARFTADRLSFFDRNGIEVAYIGDYKLYIKEAEIADGLGLGGYRIETDNGLVFKWEGVK